MFDFMNPPVDTEEVENEEVYRGDGANDPQNITENNEKPVYSFGLLIKEFGGEDDNDYLSYYTKEELNYICNKCDVTVEKLKEGFKRDEETYMLGTKEEVEPSDLFSEADLNKTAEIELNDNLLAVSYTTIPSKVLCIVSKVYSTVDRKRVLGVVIIVEGENFAKLLV